MSQGVDSENPFGVSEHTHSNYHGRVRVLRSPNPCFAHVRLPAIKMTAVFDEVGGTEDMD